MEGSLVAYKVFTNGSVLQASEINDNLMRQSVMVFSNAAARTAAITSPLEGMLTWLEDVNRYEFYNGTSWQIESSGMVLLNSSTFTGQSSVSFNNVFTSSYLNYKLVFSITTAVESAAVSLRLRASGTDTTTGYSLVHSYQGNSFTVGGRTDNATASVIVLSSNGLGFDKYGESTIYRPQASAKTAVATFGYNNAVTNNWAAGEHPTTTSFDGFTLLASTGNIDGRVRVYGLRD
jgi:hypothetical protein